MGFLDDLGSIFTGGKNPANKAMPYLQQAGDLFQPYAQQGQQAYGQLNPIYGDMATDPTAYLQKILQAYEPSKAFQTRRDEALRAAGNTAAAGGYRGTGYDAQTEGRLADQLLGEDMQEWLKNVLGIQGEGLTGLSDIYGKGYDATQNLSNVFGTEGSLAFQGQAQKNKSINDLLSALMGGAGMAASNPGFTGFF